MTGPITFSGLGSGLDIESIVQGLIGASSQPLRNANSRVSQAQAAISALSGVGTLLSDLRSVVDSLDTATELASYQGKSSNEDVMTVSANGLASSAAYSVSEVSLAKEQRSYSTAFDDQPLGQSGQFKITQDGTDYTFSVDVEDTLADIGAKINELGADVSASTVFDGSQYRLQVRSKETGTNQAFTMTETGLDLGLDTSENTPYQAAADSKVVMDGITLTSSNNTISDALSGVTFNLKQETTTGFNISVESDSASMKSSLEDFVKKYNDVVGRVHSIAGFGDSAGTSDTLKGDSSLRSITNRLSNLVLTSAGTGGSLDTLADLGIRLNNNGTLKIDATQMEEALANNPNGFALVLAGDDENDGLMDMMSDLVKGFTDIGSGALDVRKEGLRSEIKLFESTAEREQRRLDQMEIRLRSTFSAMDAQMGQSNVQMAFLAGF